MFEPRRSAAGFPMAPTQQEWDALTAEERAAVVDALPGEVTDAEMAPPEGEELVARLETMLDEVQQRADDEARRREGETRRREKRNARSHACARSWRE
jgi:hypothetical protein